MVKAILKVLLGYMNLVSSVTVSLHQNLRTHQLVLVLFLNQYGFDISFYQAP